LLAFPVLPSAEPMMPGLKKRLDFLKIQALAGAPGKAVSKNRRMSSV
jgi:hypothetical protein